MTDEAIEVASFLKAHPNFLIDNPNVLTFMKLPEQGSGNVASLHERQVQTLREKIKLLEHRLIEMTHAAVENQEILEKSQLITRALLAVKNTDHLSLVLVQEIKRHFVVPIVCLQLWDQCDQVSEQDQLLVRNMKSIYCGFADRAPTLFVFQKEEVAPASVVLIPLRQGVDSEVFGCLGLGSSDKDRFSPTLEIDFLNSLAQIACAALSRLQPTRI